MKYTKKTRKSVHISTNNDKPTHDLRTWINIFYYAIKYYLKLKIQKYKSLIYNTSVK
jgi:hypothetical protein